MPPTRRFATKKEAVETYLLENPTTTPSELAEKVTKETGLQVKGNRVSQIKLDMKAAGRFPPPQSRAAPAAAPRITAPPTPQASNRLPPVTPINSAIPAPQAKAVPDAAVKDEEDEGEGWKPSLAEKVSALRALIAAVGPKDAHCLIGLLGRLGRREGGRATGHLVLDTVIDLGEVEANQLVEVLA